MLVGSCRSKDKGKGQVERKDASINLNPLESS